MSHETKLAEQLDNGDVECLDTGESVVEAKDNKGELIKKLRGLKQILQEKSREKDQLHRMGMSVHGDERSELFAQAAICTKEIAACRKQINRVSRRLRAM
jgi:hypothetical protein